MADQADTTNPSHALMPVPAAWYRWHTTPGSVHGPADHDVECYFGDDPPDDKDGWQPLYRAASSIDVHTILRARDAARDAAASWLASDDTAYELDRSAAKRAALHMIGAASRAFQAILARAALTDGDA